MSKNDIDLKFNTLKNRINNELIDNLYIFYGEEEYLRDYYVSAIKKLVLTEGFEDFNFSNFEGKDLSVEALDDAIESLPVMAEKKLILIRNLELSKMKSQLREYLENTLCDIPEYCCIIFLYTTEFKLDMRLKLSKLFEKNALIVNFRFFDEGTLVPWVKKRFEAEGHSISSADASYFINLCGTSMISLLNEISKISAYSLSEEIKRTDIDLIAIPDKEYIIFDLIDAIANKNYKKAIDHTKNLDEDDIPGAVSLIYKQIRNLYAAKLSQNEHKSLDILKKCTGVYNDYPIKKMINNSKNLSVDWMRQAIKIISEMDMQFKSSYGNRKQLMDMLILRLASI